MSLELPSCQRLLNISTDSAFSREPMGLLACPRVLRGQFRKPREARRARAAAIPTTTVPSTLLLTPRRSNHRPRSTRGRELIDGPKSRSPQDECRDSRPKSRRSGPRGLSLGHRALDLSHLRWLRVKQRHSDLRACRKPRFTSSLAAKASKTSKKTWSPRSGACPTPSRCRSCTPPAS